MQWIRAWRPRGFFAWIGMNVTLFFIVISACFVCFQVRDAVAGRRPGSTGALMHEPPLNISRAQSATADFIRENPPPPEWEIDVNVNPTRNAITWEITRRVRYFDVLEKSRSRERFWYLDALLKYLEREGVKFSNSDFCASVFTVSHRFGNPCG